MAGITMVKVRARITIGSLVVETPFIRSFNVTKTRGQVSTFSATLKVPHTESTGSLSGAGVVVSAGEGSPSIKIFTGMVKQAKISPCWDDPYYVDLSISGVDKLFHLQGKKFTRRCRSSRASWVSINSVTRPGFKSGQFARIEDQNLEMTVDGPPQSDPGPTAPPIVPLSPKTGAVQNVNINLNKITTTSN